MSVWRRTVRGTASVCRMPRPPSSASAILDLKENNAQVSKSKTFCSLEHAGMDPGIREEGGLHPFPENHTHFPNPI